jgi:putative endonuclease
MTYYVYILFSDSLAKHYIGQTNNLEKRLHIHNSGCEKFTKKGMPWSVKFYVELDTRSDAMKLEKKLKNFKSNRLLNDWIEKMKVVGSDKNELL